MTFTDDEDKPVGNITDHVERYKQYLQKLKKGKSSGISSTFGKASDLLSSDIAEVVAIRPASATSTSPQNTQHPAPQSASEARQAPPPNAVQKALQLAAFNAAAEAANPVAVEHDQVQPAEHDQGQPREHDQGQPAERPQAIQEKTFPVKTAPDMRVSSPDGMWLWDIYYDGATALAVEAADGTLIQRTENGDYFVLAMPVPTRRFPRLEVLQTVAVDPSTGNVFWESLNGSKACAMLNNGWQIEQFHHENGTDEFFAVEPFQLGIGQPVRSRVFNLELDATTGEVTYEVSSGAMITLKSRKLK